MSLQFFDVDSDYLAYLRAYDRRVPDLNYPQRDKFFCGAFRIGNHDYLIPVSGCTADKQSSVIIRNDFGHELSSLRCAFMVPCPPFYRRRKIFSDEPDKKYRHLLWLEYQYCVEHERQIRSKAFHVYRGVCLIENCYIAEYCCNFRVLEQAEREYLKNDGKVLKNDCEM